MLYNLVNSTFDDKLPGRVNDFLNYLDTMRGKSINTINAYKTDLRMLFRFLKAYKNNLLNVELETINISDIDDDFIKNIKYSELCSFVNFLEKKGNSEYDRRRKITTMKSFYKYLQTKEKIITADKNPALELEKPKVPKRNPVYLTIDESKKLLETIEEYSKGDYFYERDYCIITLFLNCGLRLSELKDIDTVNIKNDALSVIGKGDKQRLVYLNKMCLKALNEWLLVRQERNIREEDKDALFISKKGNRMSKKAIENMVKKYVKLAEVNDKCTCHKLRHTFCTLLYRNGVDIRSLQQIMGHSNISTTTIYTHVASDELRNAINSNPLLDNMDKKE